MISELEMRAYEAFIARVATFNSPFALKGSFLTRQFCPDLSVRLPADLDWYCSQRFGNMDDAENLFNIWLMTVCNSRQDDGVVFDNLEKKEIYWSNGDYAMDSYFATINTEISAVVDSVAVDLTIEISFNWPVPFEPIAIEYQTAQGAKFTVPKAVPLPIQLSWKIHQCVTEPRLKDSVDLYLLLNKVGAKDENLVNETLVYLLAEAKATRLHNSWLELFFAYDFKRLFVNDEVEDLWEFWRNDDKEALYNDFYQSNSYSDLYEMENLPYDLNEFWNLLANSLANVGFTKEKLAAVLA